MKRVLSSIFILLTVAVLYAQQNLAPQSKIFFQPNADKSLSVSLVNDCKLDKALSIVPVDKQYPALVMAFNSPQKLGGIHIYFGNPAGKPVEEFHVDFFSKGKWQTIPSANITGNKFESVAVAFDATVDVLTDSIRFVFVKTRNDVVAVKEVCIWDETKTGIPALGTGVEGYVGAKEAYVPKIYLNQSGFNLWKPKRFTAPLCDEGTAFAVVEKGSNKKVYSGTIHNHLGDFSAFNPVSENEYVVLADTFQSFPFRIGMWWMERITYQNTVDFMIDSRHYVGTYIKKCTGSYGWRDDSHFGWELHTLVPQYLSNPAAYERMPHQIKYIAPTDTTLWGKLKPYDEAAPDIVKLMHWGVDIIVSQKLTHEHFKGQLAYFLYAWPYIKQWLPEQNYKAVKDYALKVWQLDTVDQNYAYNESAGHNMLALKTKIGSTKGALPPGASVIPNLMMYEVAKRDKMKDAEIYFKAAYNQVEWMIQQLDWENPLTTKGQRMSEFITMTSLTYMLDHYPEKSPAGLKQKINAWADVVIRRSDNMWDFRKLDDKDGWCPTGTAPTHWNEPGNVLGLPAAIFSMLRYVQEPEKVNRLNEIAYAQLDNGFGRNPCGRHCSYEAKKEIEGCDLGWYSRYPGGIGQLEEARFVIEGAPKNAHYPYHPERGNIGWSEGWVSFNVAFNLSLAYMAAYDTKLTAQLEGKKTVVRLKASLNFEYNKVENVSVNMTDSKGKTTTLTLTEESPNSEWFSAVIKTPRRTSIVSYGLGYFIQKVKIERK